MIKPVYVVSGFLDSGKTSFIKETLSDPDFTGGSSTLIIAFEEGDEPFDKEFLQKTSSQVVYLDRMADLTKEKMAQLDKAYEFDRVFLELNGLERDGDLYDRGFYKNWELAESLAILDGSALSNQLTNMRTFVFDHIRYADVAIINRCDDLDKVYIRNNFKGANPRLQLLFETKAHEVSTISDVDLFTIKDGEVDIAANDYGLWYIDWTENPMKYDQVKATLRMVYFHSIPEEKNAVIMGRRVMTCCANDIQPLAITVLGADRDKMTIGDLYEVHGKIRIVPDSQNYANVIFYADRITHLEKPEDDLVYFN